MRLELRTRDEHETESVGAALGGCLSAGDVVLLHGDLGTGKTALVRGLTTGLGGDPAEVSSPTFALVQQYHARVPLCHVDLYRMTPREVPDLGLDEVAGDSVLVVEWADRLGPDPAHAISVRLTDEGDDVRRVVVELPDDPTYGPFAARVAPLVLLVEGPPS